MCSDVSYLADVAKDEPKILGDESFPDEFFDALT